MAAHRNATYKESYKNIKLYKYMRELGIHNFNIVLIEYYKCTTKDELLCHELYDKKILLNSNRPIITSLEKK